MTTILLVIYLLAAAGVIGLVLIQQGKGADMGASFGAGASNTVFGSGGSGNFLTRMTAICATVFFAVALVFGNLATHQTESQWIDPTQGQTILEDATADLPSEIPAEQTGDEIPQ
ncbi:preprotein translocase subunit SecG [Vibrio sp. MA40-2]|uniref:preprotein translocase subunit SecG n=1 Tax=Vibrio sp. MA40-2 TaxID=3391828 RepID=UPI0039A5A8C2